MEEVNRTFSIVIVGNQHNPTILNPDFLIRTGIVNEDWPVDSGKPIITTPAHSEVSFHTGISFQMNPAQLIIRDIAPDGESFPVPEIAVKFLKCVPHVPYYRLGINFEKILFFSKLEDAKAFQKDTYLKSGPWELDGLLTEFLSKFVYKIDHGNCFLTLHAAQEFNKTDDKNKKWPGILVNANFDRKYNLDTQEGNISEIKKNISKWEKDSELFEKIIRSLKGE